ncbi:hypothetical protein SAMN05216196_1011097 [Lutimaribacter pacificus]|uniref:SGNH/GDSL hydrolase family protein n=1 Tax=Lutimaribacter pacificus TaxID=391948 RepID=A0A1H0CWB9_9RHOB|nr:SGNH/GDSL hydrolase family protein [Lutimaribacter pacificus]SDN62220.1 hypothetical protein SAMN05216196_1011097 [Lutimaribacter pacificus]SHJ39896.1 hypothetical protein SAMN05444142_101120 [Lutimaribacter pacificus]
MNRRRMLLLAGMGLAATGAAGAGAVLRLHSTPRRTPLLTGAHMSELLARELSRPRVLFIGNSMLLRHDVPTRVAGLAKADGVPIGVATLAATGARLVETMRIAGIGAVLRRGWDTVVVHDFTGTPLRAVDRWGSALAIGRIARLAAPAPLLLCPPFPAATGHPVYERAGLLARVPDGPRDFADRTMAHYGGLGHPVTDLPHRWLDAVGAGQGLYARDGHHASVAGADFMAERIWDALRGMLA